MGVGKPVCVFWINTVLFRATPQPCALDTGASCGLQLRDSPLPLPLGILGLEAAAFKSVFTFVLLWRGAWAP